MTGTVMMERTSPGVQGVPGVTPTGMGMPGMAPTSSSWLMVPRCTFKFEKCQGGLKITCVCDDPMARSMMQNLCTALQGGLCSCCCTLNGMTVCCYNLTMGMCKCDLTENGCCITCTSGDQKCCEMLQSCCDSLSCLCNAGCTCCVLMNSNPICCGCSETYGKTTSKR
jgi:hypothetical protein